MDSIFIYLLSRICVEVPGYLGVYPHLYLWDSIIGYQSFIMQAKIPWVQISFPLNRLLMKKKKKNSHCYEENSLLGARFHLSICLFSLLRTGSPNTPRLNLHAVLVGCQSRLSSLNISPSTTRSWHSHRSSAASLLFYHTLKWCLLVSRYQIDWFSPQAHGLCNMCNNTEVLLQSLIVHRENKYVPSKCLFSVQIA